MPKEKESDPMRDMVMNNLFSTNPFHGFSDDMAKVVSQEVNHHKVFNALYQDYLFKNFLSNTEKSNNIDNKIANSVCTMLTDSSLSSLDAPDITVAMYRHLNNFVDVDPAS